MSRRSWKVCNKYLRLLIYSEYIYLYIYILYYLFVSTNIWFIYPYLLMIYLYNFLQKNTENLQSHLFTILQCLYTIRQVATEIHDNNNFDLFVLRCCIHRNHTSECIHSLLEYVKRYLDWLETEKNHTELLLMRYLQGHTS